MFFLEPLITQQGTHPPLLWGATSKIYSSPTPRLPATPLSEDTISWPGGSRSYHSPNNGHWTLQGATTPPPTLTLTIKKSASEQEQKTCKLASTSIHIKMRTPLQSDGNASAAILIKVRTPAHNASPEQPRAARSNHDESAGRPF